jgi:hypothetical protein
MLTNVTVSLQDEGKRLFEDVLGSNMRLNDMHQVFQMMVLAYWVWLKKETYQVRGDVLSREGAHTAIRTMLRDLQQLWPRKSRQGWEKPKTHEQLHVSDDIKKKWCHPELPHRSNRAQPHFFHAK